MKGDMMGNVLHDRRLLAFIAALSFGAVVIALISQHVFDMQPCAWCVLQRLIYVGVGVVALVAALWPRDTARGAHRGVGPSDGSLHGFAMVQRDHSLR